MGESNKDFIAAQGPSVFFLMAPCRRLQFNLSDLYPVPRLGIGYLAAYLKANGYKRVEVRDIIAEREWIPELIARFHANGAPDLLGISITILSLREAFEIATAVKAEFPKTRIAVGGPGVGFTPEALLRYGKDVDFFVRGEGEEPILQLVRQIESSSPDWHAAPNTIWRDSDGTAVQNPPGRYRDLNDGIMVDYDSMPMDRYQLHPPMGIYPPSTMIETTRGCTFPCEFCCLSMPARYMTPANVEALLRDLIERYGLREFHFIDPTFTLDRERALEIMERIGKLNIHWSCKTRVDRFDEEIAAAAAKSGCYLVAFGVESGDDLILDAIKKKAAAGDALETFERCRRYKIRTTAYLLVANPQETEQSIQRTIRYVRELKPDYVLYDILMADPINPLTRQKIKDGWITDDDLERYYLSDKPSRLAEVTVSGHTMDEARIWLKQSSSDFYVRPKYFYERIRDLRTLQDAVNLGAGGLTFAKDFFGIGRLWGFPG
ncbi:MAG: anaerobic magnesium-protoporphyrin IX monomethyl ester cyclase [Hyphomicrobiaceae bacterium]|jgi:anaerobic magnesium-protoporphyrin IX monomethyl ester cyclase